MKRIIQTFWITNKLGYLKKNEHQGNEIFKGDMTWLTSFVYVCTGNHPLVKSNEFSSFKCAITFCNIYVAGSVSETQNGAQKGQT